MKPVIFYCYDAYCGWCYGFSGVMVRMATEYKNKIEFETLSGGMILPEHRRHISRTAAYILEAYKRVESLTGVKFGDDYLWHINNPDLSDWYQDSEKPAIALCIFKDKNPDDSILFASDLQHALYFEGRDLTDDEAYRHLLEKWQIEENEFYQKLYSDEYKEKAYYEFALVKQLQVTSFPSVLMQTSENKFYLIAQGYTEYDVLVRRVESVLKEG